MTHQSLILIVWILFLEWSNDEYATEQQMDQVIKQKNQKKQKYKLTFLFVLQQFQIIVPYLSVWHQEWITYNGAVWQTTDLCSLMFHDHEQFFRNKRFWPSHSPTNIFAALNQLGIIFYVLKHVEDHEAV